MLIPRDFPRAWIPWIFVLFQDFLNEGTVLCHCDIICKGSIRTARRDKRKNKKEMEALRWTHRCQVAKVRKTARGTQMTKPQTLRKCHQTWFWYYKTWWKIQSGIIITITDITSVLCICIRFLKTLWEQHIFKNRKSIKRNGFSVF